MQLIERPVSSKLVKKILIKNLIINTIFGYYPKEKVQKQKLKFNIKLEIDRKIKFNDNNLNTIVDYDDIMRIINNILDKKINFLDKEIKNSGSIKLKLSINFVPQLYSCLG